MEIAGEEEPVYTTAGRDYQTLECRSFWRAGNYEVSSALSSSLQGTLESSEFDRARVHPKFLHSNATSHKWAFGAIAELLDNAVDEICNGATFVKVDKLSNSRDKSPMLLVQDDGGGMDPEGIRHCMSLGFSKKKSKATIGQLLPLSIAWALGSYSLFESIQLVLCCPLAWNGERSTFNGFVQLRSTIMEF
ncbi:hypothetical protein HPP92_014503 [Vanilla planifolia]|uniref:Uncharacterized protein n=1 Tax=Vanilla planifolia TaxID=51239 RepID=A0A835UUT9_VANPL|nr:hypothetical protein HPP92_014503 [Vanilla planifolia]